ncbi:hypothetical protein BDP81DRAFT_433696 [Colletotrichum phormii]|uniref:Uncharacterized protein n=1 Tax=Colletotrichum phormii TaxID=359342 RepID=A0AAI9ZLZ2_9PEZI|nr:uncharacterized protein BDP81DRAFT_433696 [Colletotrichum phormii]KAK1634110.1 hypothetical protein BDP81DRAFT_433696 [Colletotrichum phormii]
MLEGNRHVPFWVFCFVPVLPFQVHVQYTTSSCQVLSFPPCVSVVYFLPPTFSIIPARDAMSSMINECTLSRSICIPKAHTPHTLPPFS